jgi:hypothetical protein
LSAPDVAGDWWLRFKFTTPAYSAGFNAFGAWLGDESAGPYVGLIIEMQASPGAVFLGGNVNDGDFTGAFVVGPAGGVHEAVFQYKSAGDVVSFAFDDTVVALAAGYTLDPLTLLNFVFGTSQSGGTSSAAFREVELGLGVYS